MNKKTARTVLLILLTALTAANAGDRIHPDIFRAGTRANGRIHAWVFLRDKPQSLSLSSSNYQVSSRALERRKLRASIPSEPFTSLDEPVSPDYLKHIKATGADIRRTSRWLNAVSVSATREQLESITQLSFVLHIRPVRQYTRHEPPEEEVPVAPIHAPNFSTQTLDYGSSYHQLKLINVPAVHQLGYSGRGIIVLMLDTGYYKDHESIIPERILAEYDFLEGDAETQNETDEEEQYGQHNHGTATFTVLGGYNPGYLIGPAYECSFLLAKTESSPDEYQGEEDNFVAGLEWGEALGADIVSSSLGYLDWYTYDSLDGNTAVTTRAVRWATRLGMLVVTAAGNYRNSDSNPEWGGYIIVPADADSIIAVGAVDSYGVLASFSSHGPTFDGRIKPEVVAQGVAVYRGSWIAADAYGYSHGTSMATPLVAGSAALILEAHPMWRPHEVRAAIISTASRASSPDNDYGWGIANVLAAINYPSDEASSDSRFLIEQIYPNPLSTAGSFQHVVIQWRLPEISSARLDIYDLLGRHVINLYSSQAKPLGRGVCVWKGIDRTGRNVPSGVYFIKLSAGKHNDVKRVVVQR